MYRKSVLEAVARLCPETLTWVEAAYASHTKLYSPSGSMDIQRGVQQGDPCGPAAFAIPIHDICDALTDQVDWQAWYLDDGVLVGWLAQLEHGLQQVINLASVK